MFGLGLGAGLILFVLSITLTQMLNLGNPVYQILLLGDSLISHSERDYFLSSFVQKNISSEFSNLDVRVYAYGHRSHRIVDLEYRLQTELFPDMWSFPPWRTLPFPDILV
jgi:hypothetical protein